MSWIFNERRKNDPIQGFNDNTINNFGKYSIISLVRESIQNSLDASLDNSKPVEVHFSTVQVKKDFLPNFSDIENHITGCLLHADHDANEKSEIQRHIDAVENPLYSVLLVSDFNTVGMNARTLDLFTSGSSKSIKKNAAAGGSKGVGKASFYALSYLRSVIIITKCKDNEVLGEISARISTHAHPNNPTNELMHLGAYSFDYNACCQNLPSDFHRTQIGTTIGVLGLWDNPNLKENLIREIVRNYWFSILDKKLVVEVEGQKISSDNIGQMTNLFFQDYKDYLRSVDKENPKMYFETVNSGALFEKELPELGKCKLWIHHNLEYDKNFVARFRQSRMLIEKKAELQPGYSGVFLCDSDKGNAFLRDLENDQHNEWKYSNAQGEQKRKIAKEVLKSISEFISESFNGIVKQNIDNKFSINALNDLFQFSKGKILPIKKSTNVKRIEENPQDSQPKDRVILSTKTRVKDQGDDDYLYTIEFESEENVPEHTIKLQVGTDSSKDYVEIKSISNKQNIISFKGNEMKLNVVKGSNVIEGIKLDTPFLSVPYIQSV